MTINEFRAWLDGFKEVVGDAPTPEQWAKVLAKLETVNMDWTRGVGGGPFVASVGGWPRLSPAPTYDSASSGGFAPTSSSARPGAYVNGQYAGPAD